MRTSEKWEHQFTIAKTLLNSMDQFSENTNLIRSFCSGLRNPIIFDNNVKETSYKLPYQMDYNGVETTNDHLIGMSNIVLYIFKNKINHRWNDVNDFKQTIKAFQVLLTIPKSLNNKGSFKSWQFDEVNINKCIKWNDKLKNENINYLINVDGDNVHVDVIWDEWYDKFKEFL